MYIKKRNLNRHKEPIRSQRIHSKAIIINRKLEEKRKERMYYEDLQVKEVFLNGMLDRELVPVENSG